MFVCLIGDVHLIGVLTGVLGAVSRGRIDRLVRVDTAEDVDSPELIRHRLLGVDDDMTSISGVECRGGVEAQLSNPSSNVWSIRQFSNSFKVTALLKGLRTCSRQHLSITCPVHTAICLVRSHLSAAECPAVEEPTLYRFPQEAWNHLSAPLAKG